MIPETIGALLAFLGLVAPGLVYLLRRESRQAGVAETAFREASHVALLSLALTAAATAILALVHECRPEWFVDMGAWFRAGNAYVPAHYRLVIRMAVIEVILACLLALLADWLVRRFRPGQGQVSKTSVWFQVLRVSRPAGQVPWVHAHLKSGADFWGFVGHYSAEQEQADREISLTGKDLKYRAPGETAVKTIDGDWRTVVIPAREIEYLKVDYVKKA
jgi:hypothetical protein